MSNIIIKGRNALNGEVTVQGAKNGVLPVLAGAVLCKGQSVIHNCPKISDVDTTLKIFSKLGIKSEFKNNTAVISADGMDSCEIPDELMREMRSSVVFLGAIIGRLKKAVISSPGGCELGPRPIDLHLDALKKMGVTINEEHGFLFCEAKDGLKGARINLSFPSVGATENIMLAAVTADGTTVIHNAAREPEISDLADFLNSAGARVSGGGSDTVYIEGVKTLIGTEHTVIPDRIVAATYMAAVAVTGGKALFKGIMPSNMVSVLSAFRECGCKIDVSGKTLTLESPKRLSRIPTVRSQVYPGFPTDAGPIIISMLSVANGTSVFVENIFQNRYRYIDELKRFGAKIKTEGRVALIEGVKSLSGAGCKCTDLRGGAALIIAGLCASGSTVVEDIHHIERGYDSLVSNLKGLNAEIDYI